MNGVHDMGGMHGLGRIEYDPNEPVFHEEWEGRVYGLSRVLRLGPKWNVDQFRHQVELIPPEKYLGSSYYERWLMGIEARLVLSGVLSPEEMADGKPRPGGTQIPKVSPEEIENSYGPWRATVPTDELPAKFKVGDRVRAKQINPAGHTRLPRYARGRVGIIDRDLGPQSLPDSWVARQEHVVQRTYSVRFSAEELWGPNSSSKHSVNIDMWEEYLEPA